jgi:hypothetical protein
VATIAQRQTVQRTMGKRPQLMDDEMLALTRTRGTKPQPVVRQWAYAAQAALEKGILDPTGRKTQCPAQHLRDARQVIGQQGR